VANRPSTLESASSIKVCRLVKFELAPPMLCELEESPSIKACGTVEDIQIVGYFIGALSACAYQFEKKV
jgi:hypothetical protein